MYVVQGALLFVGKVLLRYVYRVGAEVAQSIQCLDNGLDNRDIGVEFRGGTMHADLLRGSPN
jgi:hypothetical protein